MSTRPLDPIAGDYVDSHGIVHRGSDRPEDSEFRQPFVRLTDPLEVAGFVFDSRKYLPQNIPQNQH